MYFPYFRGKQFELLAIRESAELISKSTFLPIVEPVKENLAGLERTLEALQLAGARSAIIANPRHGDHRGDDTALRSYLEDVHRGHDWVIPAILLTNEVSLDEALRRVREHSDREMILIHDGFTQEKGLADSLDSGEFTHVFTDLGDRMSLRRFRGSRRVLMADGFIKQKNADYFGIERFSDLHVTYRDDYGVDGFGDYLTVGDHYSDGGGPAYAVAIHLTFIDPDQDEVMFVQHFVSDSNDTPVDPAGKFSEALNKLVAATGPGTHYFESSAIREFRSLHERRHFPGLGYVKKLSMKHHLETLADFLSRQ